MVNKTTIVNLFRYCLDNCEGNYLSFEIPSSKLDDALSLVRITGASWEITSVHGDSEEDYVTLLIFDF